MTVPLTIPTQLPLTPLERDVLIEIVSAHVSLAPQLLSQLNHAQVIDRQLTGSGFYTTFKIEGGDQFGRDFELEASADVDGLAHGAGFVLFVRDGKVTSLEGFSYEESWPSTITTYKVHRDGPQTSS